MKRMAPELRSILVFNFTSIIIFPLHLNTNMNLIKINLIIFTSLTYLNVYFIFLFDCIIISINKDQIQPADSHNTEFEFSSNQAKITFRSALQNLLTDVMPKEFKLSMKVRNTIYPSVSLSAVISLDSTGESFTTIEVNMVQDIPYVNSFIIKIEIINN